MKLGQLLAAYQEKHKLSLKEFSKQVGVDHTTLWRLMKNGDTSKQWPAILRWVFGK